MWDLSTKVLVKLHGEVGMPGRKAERDQYGFFSPPHPPPAFLAGGREGW